MILGSNINIFNMFFKFKLTLIESVWETTSQNLRAANFHDQSKVIVDFILKTCLVRQTSDNASIIFIGLEGMRRNLFNSTYKTHSQQVDDDKFLEKVKKKSKEIKLEAITLLPD